jgi:hypothetical protein
MPTLARLSFAEAVREIDRGIRSVQAALGTQAAVTPFFRWRARQEVIERRSQCPAPSRDILVSLWSAMSGVKAVIDALNVIYDRCAQS